MLSRCRNAVVACLGLLPAFAVAQPAQFHTYTGPTVVDHGVFTNVYVYPNPDVQTWEQHLASLPDAIKPLKIEKFTRASIDQMTGALMRPGWPSYFDGLYQYLKIQPPIFAGSTVASKECVAKALASGPQLQWDALGALANCHVDGHDPSPQVNLIISPDIVLADVPVLPSLSSSDTLCTQGVADKAYHTFGINQPNFSVLPTNVGCAGDFEGFSALTAHEVVEILTDPAGFGVHEVPDFLDQEGDVKNEIGDTCEQLHSTNTEFNGYTFERYWSESDHNCQPQLDPPHGSQTLTWALGAGTPLAHLGSALPELILNVPDDRILTNAVVTQVLLVLQTGDDDLQGDADHDRVDATLLFKGGSITTFDLNVRRTWGSGQTHSVDIGLPAQLIRDSDLQGIRISTHFGSGLGADQWDITRAALLVSVPGFAVVPASSLVTHQWLDVSDAPLVRFSAATHDWQSPPVDVQGQDPGRQVSALKLAVTTGNDDLRGGTNPGENCDVRIDLVPGGTLMVNNANAGQPWASWSTHEISIPIDSHFFGGTVKDVHLHTDFGGGFAGDNWNVERVQLFAVMEDLGMRLPAPAVTLLLLDDDDAPIIKGPVGRPPVKGDPIKTDKPLP